MHIHTYIHNYIHADVTYMHTCITAYMHTYLMHHVAYTHPHCSSCGDKTNVYMHIHTYITTYMQTSHTAYIHNCIHAYIPHAPCRIPAHTVHLAVIKRTYTCTYIHTYITTYMQTSHTCIHTSCTMSHTRPHCSSCGDKTNKSAAHTRSSCAETSHQPSS